MSDDPAIRRYSSRMRRARVVYFSVVLAIVVLVGAGVAVAWSNSEIAHVSMHTVGSGPPPLPIAAASRQLRRVWRTPDRTAIGDPQWHGTVVTYSPHTVRGRNARTGRRTWSYTRTDRSVCTAVQTVGITVAVYAKDGNCDELTALDSNTGAIKWTRTLDEDGKPINGTPTYQVQSDTVLISSHQVIYAIDPSSGIDRWTWYHYGCAIHHVVLGSAGALISQTCTQAQNCSGHKMCGPGNQLLLRDGVAGYDQNSTRNPDQVIWNRFGNTDIPVSADSLISAVNPATRALQTFTDKHGRTAGSVALTPPPPALTPVTANTTISGEIVWIGGRIYAIANRSQRWTARADAPPTVVPPSGTQIPQDATARITAPRNGRVVAFSGRTGRVIRRFSVRAGGRGWSARPLGAGLLVSSRSATAAYR